MSQKSQTRLATRRLPQLADRRSCRGCLWVRKSFAMSAMGRKLDGGINPRDLSPPWVGRGEEAIENDGGKMQGVEDAVEAP